MTATPAPTRERPAWRAWAACVAPALLGALVMTLLCRAAAGVSLGQFFGGVGTIALLVPPLVAREDCLRKRLAVTLAASASVTLVWLGAIGPSLHSTQWLACAAALTALGVALGGLCSLLIELRLNRAIAAALVTATAALWLTWPIWLSRVLLRDAGDELADRLSAAHPLMAINATLAHFDTWDRYPLMYTQLTVLNQDVFYALPAGAAKAVVLHLATGAATFAVSYALRRRPRTAGAPPPAAGAP